MANKPLDPTRDGEQPWLAVRAELYGAMCRSVLLRMRITNVAAVACGLLISHSAFARTLEWSVTHFALGKRSLVLGERAQTLSLKSGWVCEVGAPSGGADYEARTTTCRKGGEELRFVVQCDANRPSDHVQIQLGPKSAPDYIEVLCKPKP